MHKYEAGDFSKELQEKNLYRLAEFFKVPGNPVRNRILLLLTEHDILYSENINTMISQGTEWGLICHICISPPNSAASSSASIICFTSSSASHVWSQHGTEH